MDKSSYLSTFDNIVWNNISKCVIFDLTFESKKLNLTYNYFFLFLCKKKRKRKGFFWGGGVIFVMAPEFFVVGNLLSHFFPTDQ